MSFASAGGGRRRAFPVVVACGLAAASCLAPWALAYDGSPAAAASAASPARQATPPSPKRHFNDYASLIPADVAQALDRRLALFEQETTHQIVVAVFPELPWEPMEAFTLRTVNAWGVGQKGKNNGVVLFVFIKDRRLRLEVGLGLEKILTREVSQRILDEKITPSFKAKRYADGLTTALDAIIALLTSSNAEASP